MPVKLLILFILLHVSNKCQQNPAGNIFSEGNPGVIPGRIVVEKCAESTEIQMNDTVVFQFYEISGRGYAWSLTMPDSLNNLLKPAGFKRSILEDKDGAPEKVEFFFRAEKKGFITLKFRYSRPWEKTKPAADSCITLISIK
jgi:predicted secreted protein